MNLTGTSFLGTHRGTQTGQTFQAQNPATGAPLAPDYHSATREELDRVASKNPVVFSTGPDASLNSLALKLSKIDKDFKVTDGGPGFVEKDPKTGEPTGILRSCTRYVRSQPSGRHRSPQRKLRFLLTDPGEKGWVLI